MNLDLLSQEFRERVSGQITVEQEGVDRFLVNTPFRFDDGDHFAIVLKRIQNEWILTGEATTLMHMSYWLDDKALESGNRQEIMSSSIAGFSVENRGGELVIPVSGEQYGNALFNFVQALTKVTDLSFLSRDVVKSTFLEDFRAFMREHVPEERLSFDWRDADRDPSGNYRVDCRVNHMARPLFVYALPSEEKLSVATISLLTFERWQVPFQSLGIFEDQQAMAAKSVARFGDVVEKTYSNLDGNKDRIATYLQAHI